MRKRLVMRDGVVKPEDEVMTTKEDIELRIAEAVAAERERVWEQAIDVVRQSAKKSQAASLDIATVEIAISRLEVAARQGKGEKE